ncbi:MAG: DUF6273 domain-containing protein [Treponema sp.]|nr:DUF6273 domain-containing protein [Treponema sp.]
MNFKKTEFYKSIFLLSLASLAILFSSCDFLNPEESDEISIQTYEKSSWTLGEIRDDIKVNHGYGCIVFKAPESTNSASALSYEVSIDINGTTYTETLSQGQVLVINNIPVGKVYPVRCTAFLPTGGAYVAGTAEAKVTAGKISNLDLVLRKILTVTFMNEGTVHETKTVLSGDSVIRPSNPTKSGFAFTGWYTEADGGVKFDFGNGVRESLTLYARWEIQSEFHGTNYTPLPAGTDGTAGTDWTYVLFGAWPQTIKANDVEVDESKSVDVGMFTYYKGSDGAWYVKIKENACGNGYKYSDETEVARADANSYKYFKVEPIKWRVLTEDYNGSGRKLLHSEKILIAHKYAPSSNNYENSLIRSWLNGYFFTTAFTSAEQNRIAFTDVDNSARSTNPDVKPYYFDSGRNEFACDNTRDKIFLLSGQEVTTESYGFATDHLLNDAIRIRMPTDFAKASGASLDSTAGYCGKWWLRSPSNDQYQRVSSIRGGYGYSWEYAEKTYVGVVPALCIK